MNDKGERELLAIVFTDAVGSSSQTALDEDKSLSMLMADLDSIRNEAAARGGSVLKNTGDGLLISFKSAVDAIECALSIQKGFQGRPKGQGFQHKIGVHIGDVIKKDGDIYGAGVNTASRLVDQCAPGGICLSSTLYELTKQKSEIGQLKLKDFLLQNTEPPILAYRSHGEKSLENEKNREKAVGNTEARKKTSLILAGLALLLVIGVSAVVLQKSSKDRHQKTNVELYGFEFTPGPSENLKSVQHGAQITWTLENKTDLSLEIRWYDPDGRQKISDQLSRELSDLGPGKTLRGITYRGHVFGLFDHDKQTMLGSFRFVAGERLNLVVEKDGDRVVVNPKFLRKALDGDGLAQAQLSEAFWGGNGLPQNNQEAAKWAKKSFEQGNSFGICMLAACLDAGAGVPQDSALALKYWQRAADAGEGWAYARLGDRYLNGYGGISRNYQEAIPLLERATEKGNHWAMLNLAKAYENGLGVGENLEKAKKLYLKAAESDDPNLAEGAKKQLDEVQKRISEATAKETASKESGSPSSSK